MLTQLGRDMQYWKPRSITLAMLDEIREAKRDDPVRVALMIVNRTVWYLRPLGTQRSPMVIALVHDLQACASPPLRLTSSAPLHACTPAVSLHAFMPALDAQELADSHAVPDVEFVLNVEPPVDLRAVLAGATACCLVASGAMLSDLGGSTPPLGRLSCSGPSGSMRCRQPVLISRHATCRWTTIPSSTALPSYHPY